MALHLVRMGMATLLIVLMTFLPFLPGEYDGLAAALSAMAQLFGVAELLLVPFGVLWLAYELRKRSRIKQSLPYTGRGYYFAIASLIAASMVALAVSLIAAISIGFSLGLLTLAVWGYAVSRLRPGLKLLKKAEAEGVNPTPVYLMVVPAAVLLLQSTLAAPATEFSRNHAIAQSADLIRDIEAYRAAHGQYPKSLNAVHPDYKPSIVGIKQYHYAPAGDAYNLVFEQPTLLLDNFGTREFVVYNKLDEHLIPSHAAWLLMWTEETVRTRQGWYAVHDASSPHWKYFWFD